MRIAALFLVTGLLLLAQKDWDEPMPPHRIADNLYYVGTKGLSTYLITTPQGDILINPSFDRTVPLIRAAVEKLGYKMTDIKILLTSHAHNDHVEGMAAMQKLTGGKVEIMEGDAKVVEQGGVGQYYYHQRWRQCKVDRVLKDLDTVQLGGVTLTAHLTPGHTKGCTTWTMQTTDKGKPVSVVIVGSPNVNDGFRLVNNKDYPEIADDFARTFRVLKALQCDIFLGAHGAYYDLDKKYAQLGKTNTNPFIDPSGYKAYITEREAAYRRTLTQQQHERAPNPSPAQAASPR